MKLRCALVLFLAAYVCSFGQSASTILSSLRIKGATSEGGDPKYENYVPRLDANGTLSISIIPDLLYTNIYEHVNEYGSERNTKDIDQVRDTVTTIIDDAITEIGSNIVSSVESGISNVWLDLVNHENDPRFLYFINSDGFAMGYGAYTYTNSAYQIGTGTNYNQNTLKFMDTVIVDATGVIPSNSIPWAASRNQVNALESKTTLEKVARSGDTMSGDIAAVLHNTYLFKIFSTNSTVKIDGYISVSDQLDTHANYSGTLKFSETTDSGHEVQVFIKDSINLSFDSGINGFSGSCLLPDSIGGVFTIEIHDFSYTNTTSALCRVDRPHTEEVVYAASMSLIGNASSTGIFETVIRESVSKNPHNLSLSDINEPVSYFDLNTPSGNIYRLTCTDAGTLILTKIR